MQLETAQAVANVQSLLQEYVEVLKKDGRPATASLVEQTAQQSLKAIHTALTPVTPKPE